MHGLGEFKHPGLVYKAGRDDPRAGAWNRNTVKANMACCPAMYTKPGARPTRITIDPDAAALAKENATFLGFRL